MSLISLILAPVIATCFGWYLTRLFKIFLPFLERLVLSYIFGLSGITLLMFYFNVVGIPFSVMSALSVPLLMVGFLGLKEKDIIKAFTKKPKPKLVKLKIHLLAGWRGLSFLEKLTLAAIVFLVLTAVARALYWPVFYWDAMCAYDARAQFFLRDRLMTQVAKNISWQFHKYPPFTSLAHTYFYLLGAKNPKILYVLIYIALLVTMYYSLRSHTSRLLSLALTLLLAANPFILEHAAASYTNLAYTFFLGMGTIYLVRYFEKRRLSLFWVGTILFALSSWTRPNPEWFFVAALGVLIIYTAFKKKYFWLPIAFTLVFLIIWLPWPFFLEFGIRREYVLTGISRKGFKDVILGTVRGEISWQTFLRMVRLLLAVTRQALNYILYFFLVVFFFNVLNVEKLKKTTYLLLFIAGYAGMVFLGVYALLFTWHDWQNVVANSANRFVMIFLPLLVYFVALAFPEEQKL